MRLALISSVLRVATVLSGCGAGSVTLPVAAPGEIRALGTRLAAGPDLFPRWIVTAPATARGEPGS